MLTPVHEFRREFWFLPKLIKKIVADAFRQMAEKMNAR